MGPGGMFGVRCFYVIGRDSHAQRHMYRRKPTAKGSLTSINSILLFFKIKRFVLFQVRTLGMMIVSSCISVFSFTSLKLLPILMETLELYGCMMIYGSGCIVGALFVLFVLKETSGQSLIGLNGGIDNRVRCSDDRIPLLLVPDRKSPISRYHTFNSK